MGINFSRNKQNTKHDILPDVPQNTQQIFTKIVYNCDSVYEGYTKNKLYDGFEFTTIKILKKILKLTLVNGTITYLTEKVNVFIKMVIYMKECGQMVYIMG